MKVLASILVFAGMALGGPARAASPIDLPAYQSGHDLDHLAKPLPATRFKEKAARGAYAIAARRPKLLAQLPCYCHCDRTVGHKSLYSCFGDLHGAGCDICQKEAYFADRLASKGKPAKEIRAAIVRGDWNQEPLPH